MSINGFIPQKNNRGGGITHKSPPRASESEATGNE